MERELLLLGLLRAEEMHGYQLNEFIDSHLGSTVHLKKPTAYRLLNQMADDGWVTYRTEQEGNRPPRRIYALTAKGEAAFQRMLRESLARYEPPRFPGNTGLLFLDALSPGEASALLQQRRASVEGLLQEAAAMKTMHMPPGCCCSTRFDIWRQSWSGWTKSLPRLNRVRGHRPERAGARN